MENTFLRSRHGATWVDYFAPHILIRLAERKIKVFFCFKTVNYLTLYRQNNSDYLFSLPIIIIIVDSIFKLQLNKV